MNIICFIMCIYMALGSVIWLYKQREPLYKSNISCLAESFLKLFPKSLYNNAIVCHMVILHFLSK